MITYNNKQLELQEEAYLDNILCNSEMQYFYTALAKCIATQDLYQVYWEITHEDYNNLEDQSLACDWAKPCKIELIEID